MTRAQSILASRFLDMASERFHEDSCNDVDPETFEDLSEEELVALEQEFNAWRSGETGETCGDADDYWFPISEITNEYWMAFLAQRIGNDLFQNELIGALRIARRWMMDKPYWPDNKAEVELVDRVLKRCG